jgi:type I restriction enzyme S subunit
MNKYQSYKPTGIEWVKEIPSNWSVTKIKYISEVITGNTPTKTDEDNYSDGKYLWIKPDGLNGFYPTNDCKEKISEKGLSETRIVPPLSVLINGIGNIGKFGYSELSVSTNQQLHSIVFKTNKVDKKYGLYLISSLTDEMNKNSEKVVISIFTKSKLERLEVILPPLQEQHQIVHFLDEKMKLIDKLISIKERKISLLKEQRTSLINQLVTKGLNPNVKMKDSGVEWIGEIPEHWCLIKMKHKGEVIIGLSYSPDNIVDEGEGTLVMRSSNVQNGKPSFLDNVYVNSIISDKIRLKEGDILICSRNGSRNLIGKNCLITKNEVGLTFGVFMTVYRTQYYKFIYWLLNSPIFESQSGLFLTSTINQLTVSTLQNMVLPFVDDISEQNEIINFLNSKTKEIDDLVQLEKKKIDLLKEYRQTLISEVVTGKIKVTTDE